ncbi:MAG: small ribosomal subunit Rsm22 family protein [Candidatus Sericytochromatia bacterium]
MNPLPEFAQTWIEQQLKGAQPKELKAASEALSRHYREGLPGRLTAASIEAYLAARLPATFAAASAVLQALQQSAPSFAPTTALDLGAGPGTASLAAAGLFPSLQQLTLFEREAALIATGKDLFAQGPPLLRQARWQSLLLPELPDHSADLNLLAYVLNELTPAQRQRLAAQISVRPGVWVAIEPGTPAGYTHLIELRKALLQAHWQVWAPCPHDGPCPLQPPDWCHFSARLARSPLQRYLKQGSQNFEDEKFAYLILSQDPAPTRASTRVLRHPIFHKGHLDLTLCTPSGQQKRTLGRSDPDYRRARKIKWGDEF